MATPRGSEAGDATPRSPVEQELEAEKARAAVELAFARARVERALFPEEQPLATVGRYALFDRIGAGGMGVVFSANDPRLGRRVALKLLREPGVDARASERMLREAQTLARLSHPNVVTVHDVGVVGETVFIAMEFVEGATLSAWRRAASRSWREILDTLMDAGRGLAAVHAAGIVHRDVKPENVMIGTDGRVRLMDFGLARAHEEPSSGLERTEPVDVALTTTGAVIGTPAYMGPEQLQGEAADALSDQFGFCITLWEALYGMRPFAGDSRAALAHAIAARELATPTRTEVPQWVRRVVLRGLATSPADRWPSMDALLLALADDPSRRRIRRVALLGLGVVAVAALVGVRVDDARRRRDCAAQGAVITDAWGDEARSAVHEGIVATGAGYATSTWERIEPALDDYVAEWSRIREAACVAAEIDETSDAQLARRAEECLDERREAFAWLVEALANSTRADLSGAVSSVTSLPPPSRCEDTAWLLRRSPPPEDPEIREEVAALRRELVRARGAGDLGRRAEAMETAERVAARAKELDWDPLLAEALRISGREAKRGKDGVRAEQDFTAAYEAAVRSGDDEAALEALHQLIYAIGYLQGRNERALSFMVTARALQRRVDPSEGLLSADLDNAVASVYLKASMRDEAKAALERGLAIRTRVAGEDHPLTAEALSNLAVLNYSGGDYDAAEQQLTRALAIRERAFGDDHPHVADALRLLSHVHYARLEYDEAVALLERALAIAERAFGPDDMALSSSLHGLALVVGERGDHARALEYHRRVLAMRERGLGPDHSLVGQTLTSMAQVERAAGRSDVAQRLLERSIGIYERTAGIDAQSHSEALLQLGEACLGRYEYTRARDAQRRGLELLQGAVAPDHPNMGAAHSRIGTSERLLGNVDAALAAHERALEITETQASTRPYNLRVNLLHVGVDHHLLGQPELAELLLLRALAIEERTGDRDRELTAEVLDALGRIAFERGELLVAIDHHTRALELAEAVRWRNRSVVTEILVGLADAERDAGRIESAHEHAERALELRKQSGHPEAGIAEAELVLASTLRTTDPARARALRAHACSVAHPALPNRLVRCGTTPRAR